MKAEKCLKRIPTLNLFDKKQIVIGVLLIIPLIFIPWFLSLPVGVLSTSLGNYLGIPFLGRLILRLWQIVVVYIFGLIGLKLILGKMDLGFNRCNDLNNFLIGIFAGGGSVFLIFLLMIYTGCLRVETFAWQNMSIISFLGVFITYIISNLSIGFIEEIPFRGYLVQVLENNCGIFMTVVSSGLIFSCWHLIFIPLNSVDQLLWLIFELIPAGLILSWVYINTKSIWLVIGLHSSYNFMQQALDIYGRYGSNNSWDNLVFLGNTVKGSQILVGTPEGSAGLLQLASTILMSIIMIIYLKNMRNRDDKRQIKFRRNYYE